MKNITEKILERNKNKAQLLKRIKEYKDNSLLAELKEGEKTYFPNLAKYKEIGINITSYYQFNNVTISYLALPNNLKNAYNIYLLGTADFKGNFAVANNQINQFNWIFQQTTIDNSGNLIVQFSDITGNYDLYITYNCTKIPYIDLLEYFVSEHYYLKNLKYISTDTSQYQNPLIFLKQSIFGDTKQVSVNPLLYKNPENFQTLIIDLPTELNINQKYEICTNVNYSVQSLSFILSLLEVY